MFTVEPNDHITFGIAWQDEHLAVVEKPARVPTQPGKGHQTDTLLNGLFAKFGKQLQNLGAARDFGLLHRLDKDTSGLLIVGLRVPAYDGLRKMFVERKVRKFYWALCDGAPKESSGVIRMPIEEGKGSGTGTGAKGQMKLARIARGSGGRDSKPAITAYRVLEQSPLACLVEARPVTGRLHQIRLHMEAIGVPVLGDKFYGPRRIHTVSPRLALHSHRVAFEHPITGAPIDVRTNWPNDLRRTLRLVGLHRPDVNGAASHAPKEEEAQEE
jgi:23S rRNA pseudouridine1911/1915/1917 synthase